MLRNGHRGLADQQELDLAAGLGLVTREVLEELIAALAWVNPTDENDEVAVGAYLRLRAENLWRRTGSNLG